jgi:hypothetical protein
MEQSDEWAVQRGRYMSLETMAPVSDNPIVMLSAVPAHDRLKLMPSMAEAQMVEPDTMPWDTILLSISRSGYYAPVPENGATLALMAVIDQVFMDCPWYGSRQMARHLQRMGHAVGRRRVRRLMAKMGLAAIYQRPRTSDPHPEHRIYPYLLRDLAITRPNQVWLLIATEM